MEQNEIYETNKSNAKYLVYAIIFVAILIIAAVSFTYAYFTFNVNYDESLANINASLECVNLSLSEGDTDIGLTYDYPITDNKATSGGATPVTITVTNNCATAVNYTLTLATMAQTGSTANYIEDNKIRYKVVKNNADYKGIDYLSALNKIDQTSSVYSNLTGDEGELITKYPNYSLKEIYAIENSIGIEANTSNAYKIYLWVDYYEGDAQMYNSDNATHDTTYDGTTEGKSFAAAISLSFDSTAE